MKQIARLHGIPKEMVSGRDFKFTYNFWKVLFLNNLEKVQTLVQHIIHRPMVI